MIGSLINAFIILRQLIKKYLYTINHKRLGLNYFYFSLVTGLSGAILATAIRLEMAYPGSPFFDGDSLKYLQVITAHALIMIFFVVVPIFFGGFANYLLPYHVGSKDVAFPRLNSLGFWIQPCGYLLIAKIGFLRTMNWKNYEKVENYFKLRQVDHFNTHVVTNEFTQSIETAINKHSFTDYRNFKIKEVDDVALFLQKIFYSRNNIGSFIKSTEAHWKIYFWKLINVIPDSFYFLLTNAKKMICCKMLKRNPNSCWLNFYYSVFIKIKVYWSGYSRYVNLGCILCRNKHHNFNRKFISYTSNVIYTWFTKPTHIITIYINYYFINA